MPGNCGPGWTRKATARNKKFRRSKSREGGGGSGIEESSDEEDDPPLPADPVSSDAAADGLGLGFTKGGKAGGALTGKLGTEDMEVVLPAVVSSKKLVYIYRVVNISSLSLFFCV